ncbi:MAG: ABC transporter, substrate-binding protein (cluster 5, nickel/peptides/opines) [uncultured Thermomicrobiales bacterium]|uniref:ABC transporter, substrate-binding protein (Cluster 5, nickel/peptides/opines) n=1 Tax=uncultured Thermomicrobiales bacterium TaxID=1645740 RepID=A0A6J4UKJ2_9BACT|nr:MAG: ABC transporter, substrate-binding protein (cluster 5, nickel/peptides/opines) [uncultured Thermomicrobiales bacterium]
MPRRWIQPGALLLLALTIGLGAPAATIAQEATPAASGASIGREEFRRQLLDRFPMEPVGRTGGAVVVGETGDISTVNGILTADYPTFYVTGAIYETLVGGSPIDGTIVPGLADSWTVAPDGITYTFRLNPAATWHDGTDFTAEDVRFSFDAVLDPNTGSSYTTTVNEAVASYRVVDADTFEIVARDRFVDFLYNAPGTVLIMPRHVWEPVGFEAWTFDGGSTGADPARVVGTGPFKFREWVQGDHVTIVRNDAYWDVVPSIDEFTIRILPDDTSAVQALKTGEIDVIGIVPAAETQGVSDTPGLKVDVYDLLDSTFYAMNLDPEVTPLFQDLAVRQALFHAIDRQAITDTIFLGYGEVGAGTQPKLSPAYAPERMTTQYPFSQDRARELLAQAGWTDSDDDGTVDKDGADLSFDLIYAGGSGTVDQMVAYLQDAWRAVGVEMNPESTDGSVLLERLDDHDFEMALLAFSWGPDGGQGPVFACASAERAFNFMSYCNAQWDALEEQQKREFDPAKRRELLIQQSDIVWTEQPIGLIRFGVGRTGYATTLHNFYPNGYGLLWSLAYVWVDE